MSSLKRHCWRLLSNVKPSWFRSRNISQNTAPLNLTPRVCEDPFAGKFSEIIDVRTVEEFNSDHIPGAVNLPILDSGQRHSVGLLYSQNQFDARKLGAQIISENISGYLSDYFRNKTQDYSPLVYCWRGGKRSQSLGIVLSQIGFDVSVLAGGYVAYRGQIRQQLAQLSQQLRFNVISGLTGSGKTLLLQELHLRGEQVLDLEGLANHRGSLLGNFPGLVQPSQKYMESLLVKRLLEMDPARTVWVESESQRIGLRTIPNDLFASIRLAKKVYSIELPVDERVQYILHTYSPWMEHTDSLKAILSPLQKYQGSETVRKWFELIDGGHWSELVRDLLEKHYDKTYNRSQRQLFGDGGSIERVPIPDLTPTTLSDVVTKLTSDV